MLGKMLAKPVKYITLDGSPVGYPLPLRHLLRADFLAAAASIMTFTALSPKADIENAAKDLAIIYGLQRVFNLQRFRLRHAFGDKIITTQPTEAEKTNSFRYAIKAKEQVRESLGHARFDIFLGASMTGINLLGGGDGHFMAAASITWTAGSLATAFRFNKVANSEWAIITEPPKEKLLEHFKKEKKTDIRLPVPQTA